MAAAEVVRARIDAGLKRDATEVLGTMGLSVSDAIRMMLVRVVADRSLPFEVRSPIVRRRPLSRQPQMARSRASQTSPISWPI
jgi:DNA-damage-inducible protein J